MLVLGLQGSPRRNGNTRFLLSAFLEAAERRGARTRLLSVPEADIRPCRELGVCEKRGTCPIRDDLAREGYGLIREAEVVVLASPVFFYGMTAQIKALVDRCQVFWARKYRLRLADPRRATRRGFVLSVGATRGKNLFEGLLLSARYFLDAIDAPLAGSLLYRGIEGPGDLARHPAVRGEVEAAVEELLAPLRRRRRLLFLARQDDGIGPMAAALAGHRAAAAWEVHSAGLEPAANLRPGVAEAMAEQGIDIGFQRPRVLAEALAEGPPDVVVALDAAAAATRLEGAQHESWEVPALEAEPPGRLRDALGPRVEDFLGREAGG